MVSARVTVWICSVLVSTLASALSVDANAQVDVRAEPMEWKVEHSDVVVRGRLVAVKQETYTEDGLTRLCGTNFDLDLIERFKGNVAHRFRVSSVDSLLPVVSSYKVPRAGQDLLVLAINSAEAIDPTVRESFDVDGTSVSTQAHRRCLQRLGPYYLAVPWESAFLVLDRSRRGARDNVTWLVFNCFFTSMPHDVVSMPLSQEKSTESQECGGLGEHIVPWSSVRGWLANWSKPKSRWPWTRP
jgi:hypothetical protein